MKKILCVIIVLVLSLTLSACKGSSDSSSVVKESSSTVKESSNSTVESSSSKAPEKTSEEYTAEAISLAYETKLEESFTGKEFVKDGIGEVTLAPNGAIDGDTIHVYSDNQFLQIRFLAIDTKESTGTIQPWGKPASNFTKDKVENAESIVLQSDVTGPAKTESNGRYLAWVWILSPGENEYVCLNILLVAESLSQTKGATDSRYAENLIDIYSLAIRANIKINNNDSIDPLFFYGDAISVDLKELRTKIEYYYAKKVKFDGIVTSIDGGDVYIESLDAATGLRYGITVYIGYKQYKILQIGNEVSIIGTVAKYFDAYQITGVSYDDFEAGPNDMSLISKGNVITPTLINAVDLDLTLMPNLECTYVQLDNIVVTETYVTTEETSSVGAITITGTVDGVTVKIRTNVLKKADGSYVTTSDYDGKTISVRGFVEQYSGTFQIKVISFTNVDFLN